VTGGKNHRRSAPPPSFPPTPKSSIFGDATLLPGFIDAHTHLTYEYSDDYKPASTSTTLQKNRCRNAPLRRPASNARVTLMAGFTTVRDVGLQRLSRRRPSATASATADVPGPRMLVHCVLARRHWRPLRSMKTVYRQGLFGREIRSAPGASIKRPRPRRALRPSAWITNTGADMIKVCCRIGRAVLSPTDDRRHAAVDAGPKLDAIVDEAHAPAPEKPPPTPTGAEAAKARHSRRGAIDSIEHGQLSRPTRALDMMVKKGTYLVPTLMAIQGIQEEIRSRSVHASGHRKPKPRRNCRNSRHLPESTGQRCKNRPGHGTRVFIRTAETPRNFTKWWTWAMKTRGRSESGHILRRGTSGGLPIKSVTLEAGKASRTSLRSLATQRKISAKVEKSFSFVMKEGRDIPQTTMRAAAQLITGEAILKPTFPKSVAAAPRQ